MFFDPNEMKLYINYKHSWKIKVEKTKNHICKQYTSLKKKKRKRNYGGRSAALWQNSCLAEYAEDARFNPQNHGRIDR